MEGRITGAGTGCDCSEKSGCCPTPDSLPDTTNSSGQVEGRRLNIDFLYLDLSVCTRCQGTGSSLEDAISEVAGVLEAAGITVNVRKIHVQSEEQALESGFVSSPTIRVNGRDIQLEVKENLCESCGDLCGEDVDCRVWVYRGREYSIPPKAMIIEAILREVYGGASGNFLTQPRLRELPDNLKRFFAGRREKGSVKP